MHVLHNAMDLTHYFLPPSEGDKLDGRTLNSTTPGDSKASILSAERKVNNLTEREEVKKKKQLLPENL